MAVIQANRESIDDRFSVLGFTIRTENPLFEIGLATDPELLKAENRQRRTSSNFFSSKLLAGAPSRRGEAVYLVPPNVVARFVGQPRLYFGVATYDQRDRSHPSSVSIPDRGNMYVSLSGLTERGLRRTARPQDAGGYGGNGNGNALAWGGDALTSTATRKIGNGNGNGSGNGHGTAASASDEQPAYSDGYSDDLWQQSGQTTAAAAPGGTIDHPANRATASQGGNGAGNDATPATAQSYHRAPLHTGATQRHMPLGVRRAPLVEPLLVSSYYQPTGWVDALRTQLGFFVSSAMWFLGVSDTRSPPHSAICQVRRPDGSAEGALHGSAFFIAPNLLLTAAHVVDGQSELIIVPGKNGSGAGSTTEPFGRFRVAAAGMRKHPSYNASSAASSDFDMALIRVPATNAARADQYFDLVEELLESRPEGVVVCGYAARWYANDLIEHFVNENIDPNLQHLHGGHIRSLPTDETFDYDLQTLGGTSGSPVYWIQEGSSPRAHMVGVHVAAHSKTTNLGCRITAGKLSWIRGTAADWGQTMTFSLGTIAQEPPAAAGEEDPDAYGISEDEPVSSASEAQALRALTAETPDYPAASRFVPAHARNFTRGRRSDRVLDRIVVHITAGGPSINGTIAWFQNGDRVNQRTGKAIRSSSHYIVGRDGEVVQMVRDADTAHHASAANSRSIGIEHNANKPSAGNQRDLPPTEPQYEASARLVAWLCRQYNLPADREHIRGHFEISPRDNHDCPSSIWDWDRYMEHVHAAAAALGAPTAQGLGAGRAYAVAQEIITPFYDPADSATALSSQADAFSLAREEWFAGVPDTRMFPHSAICLLEMRDAGGALARGTGFYIGRNRILTCAHNLHGQASVDIVPGKNGQGSASEPFGRATVTSDSWRIPASYGGSNAAFDLAVIDNVPIAAPGDRWFDVLEELDQSRPEGVVVCGYSSRSTRVPELTSAIDGFKQHLHAGYIAALGAGDSTFDYPILTLARASGSPVYYISDKDGSRKAYIVGVHISGAGTDMNRGCRLSQAKIDWIQGRATSLALGVPSRALVIGPEDVERAQRHAPHWADLFNWTPPDWLNGALAARSMRIQRIQDAIGELNLDRYEVRCTSLPTGWSETALLDHVRANLNDFLDTDNSQFIPYAIGTDDVKWGSSSPVGAVFKIDIVGPDNAAVVGSLVEDRRFRFTTIHTSWSGDHPVSGHREFGVRSDGDAAVFYTRGADRATNGILETAVFAGAHHLWLSFQRKLSAWINANGGNATVPAPFSERFHPDVVRILFGSTSQALSSRPLEIPLDPGIGGQSIGLDALSPGDIIVSTARHPVSYAIRAGTLSAISHAMLYAGDGNIIEAVGDGVREVPLGTAIGDAILAVSYRDPRVDSAKAAAIVAFARSQLGRPYNFGGAARAGYRIIHPLASRVLDTIRDIAGVDDTSARTFYCSELVFAAFEAAGIPLVAAPAGDSTPNDVVQLTRGSLGYVGHLKARDELLGVALSAGAHAPTAAAPLPDFPVGLIPQPSKEASWAAAMAMLLSWRHKPAAAPRTVIEELGTTLATSYNEALLAAAQERYGFRMIAPLADTGAYHSPQQWAQWLGSHGPLWVLIVGAPHAVVISGIRGDLANPATVQVRMLNPWDTRVAFDGDPVDFHPANQGYEDWIAFEQFAADFGNMARPDYSDWRVLHLPATPAGAQSPGTARNGASQDVQQNAPVSSSQGLAAVAAGEVVKHIVKEVLTSSVPGRITIRADKFGAWYFPGGTPLNVDRSERHTLYLSDRPVMLDPPMAGQMGMPSFELFPRTRDYETIETHTPDGGVLGPDFTSDEHAQFRTFQNFKIKWASDGASVGLIYIEAEDGAAADETKLDVTAEIQMHPSLEPSDRPTYARVDVVFKQVFTDRRGGTHRGESVISLRGDGTSVGRFNWTAR